MIQRHTISGRPASVAYMHPDFTPASDSMFALAKVLFDDGETLFISSGDYDPEAGGELRAFNRSRMRKRPPVDEMAIAGDHEAGGWSRHRQKHAALRVAVAPSTNDIPVKLQLVAWAKAIMVLDASEVLIRDLIERELVGIAGTNSPKLILVARSLSEKIRGIREEAIKVAFRMLRDRLGDNPVLDHSFAAWAAAFAAADRQVIEGAIQTGLIAGLDNTEIARKVVGSMGLNGVDGVTEFTRHRIAHLGRAAIKESRR